MKICEAVIVIAFIGWLVAFVMGNVVLAYVCYAPGFIAGIVYFVLSDKKIKQRSEK